MKILRLAVTAAALLLSFETTVQAQTTLRIGLAEDPDILDPTLARTYVGRIVFAAFCDKLFDIDEKLNIVPQLALSHETSDDGKEVYDQAAARASNSTTASRSTPRPRNSRSTATSRCRPRSASRNSPQLDHVDVVDPLTIKLVLKTPFSPLIAQLTDRAGMMVSPKAAKEEGDKFGLKPVCAGPYKFVERVQQDRIVFEKFADYWNKDKIKIDRIVYLPLVDATVRLANLKSGGLDLIERLLATDIKAVQADPKLKLSTAIELGYQGVTLNVGKDKTKGPLSQSAKVRQALDLSIDREAINQVVFNGEFKPGNQWVNPDHPYYQKAFPVRGRDVAKAKALLKEAGVTDARERRFHGAEGRGNRSRRAGDPVDGGGGRLRHEDQGHRVRDLAEAGRGRRIPGLHAGLERTDRSRRQFLRLPENRRAAELQRLVQSRGRQGARRRPPRHRSGAAQGDL